MKFLNYRYMQESLVQATFWHDPFHEAIYKQQSTFLADINNEVNINQSYKDNLQLLKRLLKTQFLNITFIRQSKNSFLHIFFSDLY